MNKIFLICVSFLFSLSQAISANILPNPSFEDASEGKVTEWVLSSDQNEPDAVQIDTTAARSGKNSVRIKHEQSSYSRLYYNAKVEPNKDYTASCWIKADNLTLAAGGIGVRLFMAKEGGGTLVAQPAPLKTYDWKEIKIDFNSGERKEIQFLIYLHKTTGTAWFDDVSLTPKGETAPAPATSPAAEASQNMVQNPSFELVTDEKAEPWILSPAADEKEGAVVDNAEAQNGNYSLRMTHKAAQSYSQSRQRLIVNKNTDYTLTFWMKGADITAAGKSSGAARIFIARPDGSYLAGNPPRTGTFNWELVTISFNSATFEYIVITPYLHQASGSVWFDNLTLFHGKAAPIAAAAAAAATASSGESIIPDKNNIALNKPYTLSRKPNYSLCTDAGDDTQLTDGKNTVGYFWTQKSTVGWQNAGRVQITIDLGASMAVGKVAVGAGGGKKEAGVNFPDVVVFISDDNKSFSFCGAKFASEMADTGDWYRTDYEIMANGKGRYLVIFVVANGAYMFLDEIRAAAASGAVTKGTQYAADNLGDAIFDMRKFMRRKKAVGILVADLKKNTEKDKTLKKMAADVEEKLFAAGSNTDLDNISLAIGKINARVAAANFSGRETMVWQQDIWQDFGSLEQPPAAAPDLKNLRIVMAANEYANTGFNIFNLTDTASEYTVQVTDLKGPGTISSRQISIRGAELIECFDWKLRPDALALLTDGKLVVNPGQNKQVWLIVKADNPAGTYRGEVRLARGKAVYIIALEIEVLKVRLPEKMPLRSYNWGYLNFAPVAADVNAALSDMRAHYCDTHVIHPAYLPKFSFNADGSVAKADFTDFDEKIKLLRSYGATQFKMFTYFGDIGHGVDKPLGAWKAEGPKIKLGSVEWKKAMRDSLTRYLAHLKEIKMDYQEHLFYPFDEPNDKLIDGGGLEVYQMIQEIDPKLRVFVDPTSATSVDGMKKIAQYISVWCPHDPNSLSKEKIDFFHSEQAKGKEFRTYNCEGPDKTFSPLGHYRQMLWRCFELGITGAGIWNYADTGYGKGETSAWTDFDGSRIDFSIIYDAANAPKGVNRTEAQIPSRRWEAWRDGIEDYALLYMLRQKATGAGAKKTVYEKLIADLMSRVQKNSKEIASYEGAHEQLLRALAE